MTCADIAFALIDNAGWIVACVVCAPFIAGGLVAGYYERKYRYGLRHDRQLRGLQRWLWRSKA